MTRPRFIALWLALITIVVYLPAAHDDFSNYDDPDYVTDNPHVLNGLNGADLAWAFTTGHASNWHPLTWISLQTDSQLFGPNAGAFHLVNVLFHAANVTMLFILLVRLTGRLWPSALVAALFAWHPLHVESVAWVSERKDVLSTCFALLALLSYQRFARENSRRSFWFALVYFALGLLAKPMLVTLPFVLLLLDFWPLNRLADGGSSPAGAAARKIQRCGFKQLLLEKWPFFGLAALSCVVTYCVQKSGHAVLTLQQLPLGFRLENAPVAVLRYVLKLFWPANLAVFYPLQPISIFECALALLLLGAICVVVLVRRVSQPWLLTGWFWFVGTLVPVIGLVQVGSQSMADRYSYIPSIGLFLGLVFWADGVIPRRRTPLRIGGGLAALLLSACLWQTERQLQYWVNSETLFRHALAVTQNNDVAHLNFGLELEHQGRLAEALAEYHKTLEINPDYPELHNNLGMILDKFGRHAESLAEYRIALGLRPDDPFLHNAVGSELAELGRGDEALQEFHTAEQLDPQYAPPHLEIAKVLFQQGRQAEGLVEFRKAAALAPDNFKILAIAAHYLAAVENDALRDPAAALTLALRADELSDHAQPMVMDILGITYAANGDFPRAQACVQKALETAEALQMTNTAPFRQRLADYQRRQPWRESFSNPAPGGQ